MTRGPLLTPGPPFDHSLDEQGPSELERHRQPLMVDERLLAGGPGALEVAVNGREMGAAARTGRQRPRAPERHPARLELLCERPCAINLAERGQRLDRVGEEPDDARFAEAERSDRLGEAV